MNVILSSNIHHYNHAARAFAAEGALNTYITGAQFARPPFFLRLLPEPHRSVIAHRVDPGLAGGGKLRSMWFVEAAYKSLLRVKGVNRGRIVHYHNELFDWMASMRLTDCQYFHFVSSIGYKSALKAKRRGAKLVLDERAEHPLYLEALLEEERRRLGLPAAPAEADANPVTVKMLKEYGIADYMIVASEYAKRTFVAQGIAADRVFVLPYGCDGEQFHPQPKRDATFRVISVGQITPRKGTAYLIEAFKRLPAEGTELVLIGRADAEMAPIMKDLPANIVHLPHVPHNKLNDYYTDSSVFALASLSDSFGLVVLEAMNAGLPVIVTDNVGAADTVTEGLNGYVVPIRDSDALFAALDELYRHPERQLEMSRHAVKQAGQFGWDRYMTGLIGIYQELAARA